MQSRLKAAVNAPVAYVHTCDNCGDTANGQHYYQPCADHTYRLCTWCLQHELDKIKC